MKHSLPSQGDTGLSVMTLQRLQQLLDAYGADPERWPAEERLAALALLAHSPEAQTQREQVAHPSAELAARILAAAPTEKTQAENPRNGFVRVLRSRQRYQLQATRRN